MTFSGFTTGLTLLCSCLFALASSDKTPFVTLSSGFSSILGSKPKLTPLLNVSLPLFHEAGVWHSPTKSLFAVTDILNDPSINNNQSTQLLVHVTNLSNSSPTYKLLNLTDLPNPTGGVLYKYHGADLIAMLATGSLQKSGGLFLLNPYHPFNVTPLTTAYGQLPYNSPNDVTVLANGDIYFTDPIYGLLNGVRPAAYLPNQVYRYSSSSKTTRVVADGFGRPNGITHSPDGSTIYISDTGANIGNGSIDYQGPRSIYAYSISEQLINNGGPPSPFLAGRHVFAMPDVGAADGLKTDTKGNVWGFTTDGLHVWDKGGNALGKVLCEGGTGNFGFGDPGVIYIMGSHVLYRLEVDPSIMGTGVLP